MKNLLLLLAIATTPLYSLCQDWPAQGAQWHYCTSLGNSHYVYTSDSLINDTTYSIVRPTTFNGAPYSYQQALESFDVLLFRQSNDTIFRRVFEDEYIYFINGLDIGDTFTTFRSSYDGSNVFACEPELELQVSQVVTENLGDQNYRVLTLEDINFTEVYGFEISETGFSGFTYIESIGLEFQFPYVTFFAIPGSIETGGCNQVIGEPYISQLFEFGDLETEIIFSDCTLSATSNRSKNIINVFPNPATRLITVDGIGESIITYQIFAYSGNAVSEGVLESNSIDLSDLPSGLYFLQIFDNKGLIDIHKVIVQ